jgi:hypothetical protein
VRVHKALIVKCYAIVTLPAHKQEFTTIAFAVAFAIPAIYALIPTRREEPTVCTAIKGVEELVYVEILVAPLWSATAPLVSVNPPKLSGVTPLVMGCTESFV